MLTSKKTFPTLAILLLFSLALASQPGNGKKVLWTVAWSPNSEYIATGGDQGDLKIFDGKTFDLIHSYDVNDVILSRLKWHPSENKLAVVTQSESFKARILDLDQDSWLELSDMDNSFRGLDWNHNGEFLAVSDTEGDVFIFDGSGKQKCRFRADAKGATGLDWHPHKDILISVGSQIGFYNLSGDTLLRIQPAEEERFLLCVEWHPSGEFFVVGDYGDLEKAENKLLQFWNEDGLLIHEIPGSTGEYRNIRWSPDGEKLASASDALRIWTKEGKLLSESKSMEDYLWGIDWSPDGKTIITTSSSGTISLWDNQAKLIGEISY